MFVPLMPQGVEQQTIYASQNATSVLFVPLMPQGVEQSHAITPITIHTACSSL